MTKYKEPDWYDRSKLIKVRYAEGETGWAVDMGDGSCRLANSPLIEDVEWGDRVELLPDPTGADFPSIGRILEKYDAEVDRISP